MRLLSTALELWETHLQAELLSKEDHIEKKHQLGPHKGFCNLSVVYLASGELPRTQK